MALLPELQASAPDIAALRRDIHAHPELCFEEIRTSDLVADKLEQWGVATHRGLGTTGVVGIIHGRDGGKSGRAIGLRADMDALPMQEFNTFEHASRHAGKMHACGHDGHTAMLLAAAQYLAAHRDSFEGTVYAIFQPAEEGGGGAREMVKDGLFTQFPMQAVFGMHNWPGMKAGTMAVGAGPAMASSNEFKIVVRGKGGHAAMPHMVVDPVPVAAQLIMAFQTIVSRNVKPIEAGVVPQEPSMGAEDFAFMLMEKPGAYCFIANGDGDHRAMGHGGGPCTLHNPSYDFNDALIPLGATFWVKLAQRWLAEPTRA